MKQCITIDCSNPGQAKSPEEIVEVFADGLEEEGLSVRSDRATKILTVSVDSDEVTPTIALIEALADHANIILTGGENTYQATK